MFARAIEEEKAANQKHAPHQPQQTNNNNKKQTHTFESQTTTAFLTTASSHLVLFNLEARKKQQANKPQPPSKSDPLSFFCRLKNTCRSRDILTGSEKCRQLQFHSYFWRTMTCNPATITALAKKVGIRSSELASSQAKYIRSKDDSIFK